MWGMRERETERVRVWKKKRLKPGAKAFSILVLWKYTLSSSSFFSRLARQSVTKLQNGIIRVAPFEHGARVYSSWLMCECCCECNFLVLIERCRKIVHVRAKIVFVLWCWLRGAHSSEPLWSPVHPGGVQQTCDYAGDSGSRVVSADE